MFLGLRNIFAGAPSPSLAEMGACRAFSTSGVLLAVVACDRQKTGRIAANSAKPPASKLPNSLLALSSFPAGHFGPAGRRCRPALTIKSFFLRKNLFLSPSCRQAKRRHGRRGGPRKILPRRVRVAATLSLGWDTQVIAFTHPTQVRGGEDYIRIDDGNALTCVSHVSHDHLQTQPLAAALAAVASAILASLAPGLRAMPL